MGKISAASRQSVKSISQLRERMAAFGWSANELSQQDTGEDVLVKIFNPGADARFDGTPSGLSFLAQVKSVAETVAEGLSVTIQLKVSDLKDWTDSDPSVVLFVWDVRSKIGYWRLANAICKELDETNPGWKTKTKVSTRFPVADSSDDAGLKRLRGRLADVALPSIARGRKVQVKLRFTFPKAIAKKVQRAYDFGTPYSIDPSYLSGIDFPDWYTRLYGISRPEIAGPVIMNAKAPDLSVDVRMEVKAPGELETLEFAVRATRVGEGDRAHQPGGSRGSVVAHDEAAAGRIYSHLQPEHEHTVATEAPPCGRARRDDGPGAPYDAVTPLKERVVHHGAGDRHQGAGREHRPATRRG